MLDMFGSEYPGMSSLDRVIIAILDVQTAKMFASASGAGERKALNLLGMFKINVQVYC